MQENYKINYDELAETAKSLKTLDKSLLKSALKCFSQEYNEVLKDSDDSESNKNLVDQMMQNISQFAYDANANDKFNVKKRWWTN